MTRLRRRATLLLPLALALGGSCTGTTSPALQCIEGTKDCVCDAGDCVAGLVCEGNVCREFSATTGTSGSSSSGSSGGAAPVAPEIVSFDTNVATITQNGTFRYELVVQDDNGLDDVVGAVVTDAAGGLTYGELVQDAPGEWSLLSSWSELHAIAPISMAGEEERVFLVTVTDAAGLQTTATTALKLTCVGLAACDGLCFDLDFADEHCGSCGHACEFGGGFGGCDSGECAPRLIECVDASVGSCDAACSAAGSACVAGACGTATYVAYDSAQACMDLTAAAASSAACDVPVDANLGASFRCCCAG
jgi:hypothetical protein